MQQRKLGLAAVVLLLVSVTLAAVQAVLMIAPIQVAGLSPPRFCACPSQGGIFVYDTQAVDAGSPGCVTTVGEVCFSIFIGPGSGEVFLNNVSFQILNSTNDSTVSLPSSSSIVLLNSTDAIIAAWSPSYREWETGGTTPVELLVHLVLDSGMTTDLVSGDWFVAAASGAGSSMAGLP